MTVYNKSLGYIGFAISVIGGLIGYYSKNESVTIVFQMAGVMVMLLSLKKPKGNKDNSE